MKFLTWKWLQQCFLDYCLIFANRLHCFLTCIPQYNILYIVPGLHSVRVGLWIPNPEQCIPSAQARYKDAEEGSGASVVGRQDQLSDPQDHLPGAQGAVRLTQGLCCLTFAVLHKVPPSFNKVFNLFISICNNLTLQSPVLAWASIEYFWNCNM